MDFKNDKRLQFLQKTGLITLFHPVEYVKVLVQIGHEPIRPYAGRTLFGRRVLKLPGVYKYICHIKSVDGVFGLYRGLAPRLCGNLIYEFTYDKIFKCLPNFLEPPVYSQDEEDCLSDIRKVRLLLQRMVQLSASTCFATIVTYPFQVIAVRTMAQFVGREDFGGFFQYIVHIFKEEGIKGFFSGLIPKLLGDIYTIFLSLVATFVIKTYIIKDKSVLPFIDASVGFFAKSSTYSFTLVSTVMAVNDCGLAAGAPPNATIYLNWRDCWTHLRSQRQLQRGSNILWRYYKGPVMLDSLGNPTPVDRTLFKSPGN